MAIILPQEGNIWQTLGSGLGTGLQALAQGKIQQLQNRNYADALESMGLSRDIAYLPQQLQETAIQQHYKGLEALQQQEKEKKLYDLGISLGGNPEELKKAQAAGRLKKAVDKLEIEDVKSIPQMLRLTASKQNKYRLGAADQNFNKTIDDTWNQTYQNSAKGIDALKQMGVDLNNNQKAEILLQDPNVSNEQKQAIRNAQYDTGTSEWLYTPLGALGNLASGLTQGFGTAGGILPWLNQFAPGEEMQTKWDNYLRNVVATADPKSPEYKEAEYLLSQSPEKPFEFPSEADIKEDLVRPLAKAIGLDKFIDPKNFIEKGFERAGKIGPWALLGSMLTGGPLMQSLLQQTKIAGLAEGAGQLTKDLTGSDLADASISTLGYLTSGFSPKILKDAISKGYNLFEKGIEKIKPGYVSMQPFEKGVEGLRNEIMLNPTSKNNKFLAKKLANIANKAPVLPEFTAKKFGLMRGESAISPKTAYALDQSFGKEMKSLKDISLKDDLHKIREALREVYQPFYMKEAPAITEALINSRNASAALKQKDDIEKFLTGLANFKGGIFNPIAQALRFFAKPTAKLYKYSRLFITNPLLRNAMVNVLKSAAQKNTGKTIQATTQALQIIKDEAPEIYKEITKK